MKLKNNFSNIIIVGLVVLWAYAGITKLLSHSLFAQQLESYPIVGHYATLVSYIFSISMLVTAALLPLQVKRIQPLTISAIFLSFITGYLIYVTKFSGMVPCSCNGIWPSDSWNVQIGINLFVLLLNITAIYFRKSTEDSSFYTRRANHAL